MGLLLLALALLPFDVAKDALPSVHVVYGTTSLKPGGARREIDIAGDGRVRISFIPHAGRMREDRSGLVTRAHVISILDAMAHEGFLDWQESYRDPDTLDGQARDLRLVLPSKEKRVEVINFELPRFSKIAKLITDTIDQDAPGPKNGAHTPY